MYFIILYLVVFNIQLIHTENTINLINELDLNFGHIWSQRDDMLTVYFNISNLTFKEYRYYYYDFRPFALQNSTEYFPRQRLIDTQNSLRIIGLHEGDYVSCVSFIDEYENILKPRYACYEFTLGEKTVGSHHSAWSGHLAPLLLAVAFVIHVIIVVVHHIKAKNYAHKLLQRFIDVNPKATRKIINVKRSLKQLDHPHISASVQRRLSRVTIDANEDDRNDFSMNNTDEDIPIYVLPHNRRVSLGVMQTIREQNP
ncbi:unnamed protein product [Rotaria sp. Silwood2]|nr:unnamed protein product [Rotaria sp. Silwood2]CAF3004024.1 unnamed protein product [Rotaria sp. Silwood2]CAF3333094.1 unnamed protein product [Rotaria sp. Silwood2]CAF4230107.1 unnamed protein product [Rotaria sp. Silwood2]CAF4349734.1 unnamed protein product [Rotaria sp. Silwood2]